MINLTKTAALELAPHGIRVNAIAPDITITEGIRRSVAVDEAKLSLTVPLGRVGHVDDIAGAAVFLASGLSSYVTGHTLHVDGGTRPPRAGTTTPRPATTPTAPPEPPAGRRRRRGAAGR